MASKNNNTQDEIQNERILLFNRLMKQKDAILVATQEIEDLRKRFLQANKQDADGTIESEIQKRIYTIISALSELFAYTNNPGTSQILLTTTGWATSHRMVEKSQFLEGNDATNREAHIAESRVLDALCASVNIVRVEWRLKKEPLVNISNLESLFHVNLTKPN